MFVLAILLIAPFVLAAHLFGASWGLAVLIGLSIPAVGLVVALIVAAIIDARTARKRRKRAEEMRARRRSN
jgi:hypothetical protein